VYNILTATPLASKSRGLVGWGWLDVVGVGWLDVDELAPLGQLDELDELAPAFNRDMVIIITANKAHCKLPY
jgi:hypothetical protein